MHLLLLTMVVGGARPLRVRSPVRRRTEHVRSGALHSHKCAVREAAAPDRRLHIVRPVRREHLRDPTNSLKGDDGSVSGRAGERASEPSGGGYDAQEGKRAGGREGWGQAPAAERGT